MIDELFASLGLDVARLEPETIALLRRKYTAWVTYRKNAARPNLNAPAPHPPVIGIETLNSVEQDAL
jgi:hypothetical protein